ncbi:uncharacterized protein EV422DRAFT_504876 [Fimicolochytrium jonesii]|uniref:uncharacterized protein n=1 Tax=Fimicolochytrium jonesii TaxID=1396493 RepID=UPI0022FEA038|nr:uncharacterized protein EV422DRAFT_504876 [Fimicolochytrium jonesii]KAI8823727.1 hypothetical protein EV422DRAFT_504876 [Fimicolochytrium jonesii]
MFANWRQKGRRTSPNPLSNIFQLQAQGTRMADEDLLQLLRKILLGLGLALQFGNSMYAARHAWMRPVTYNLMLLTSCATYAGSFIPLFAAKTDDEYNIYPNMRIWTALYGVSTLMYTIIIQIRFRAIKALLPYGDVYIFTDAPKDRIFLGVTVCLWCTTIIPFGVVIGSRKSQSLFTAAWTAYVLLVDNVISFMFISQVYKCQAILGGTRRKEWARVVGSLAFVCVTMWISVLSLVAANLFLVPSKIFYSFQFVFCCTPLQFSGALVFIYNAQALVSPGHRTPTDVVDSSGGPSSGGAKGLFGTKHSDTGSAPRKSFEA